MTDTGKLVDPQFKAQLDGLAFGLDQHGEASAAQCVRRAATALESLTAEVECWKTDARQMRELAHKAEAERDAARSELALAREALRGPTFIQGDGGWYAISLATPKLCFFGHTLEKAQELVASALEFYAARLTPQDEPGGKA